MSSPHDALFKATFSKPENAVAELRLVLPKNLVAAIDFSTLTVLGSHFVDDDLEGSESDLLFSVQLEGNEALLYVLMEHQSTVDWSMPLRLLRYMVSAWEQHTREHPAARRLPPIVPVVLHHSESGWSAATSLGELWDLSPGVRKSLAPYVPDFRFVLHDLSREDLSALRDATLPAQLKLVLFLLQRTRDNPALDQELSAWIETARELADDALRLVLSYILMVTQVERGPIGHWAERVSLRAEEAYVTLAEKIALEAATKERAKALVEGRREGRLEGRLEGQLEGRRETLRQLLEQRFGPAAEAAGRRIQAASEAELKAWTTRVLVAQSLEDVFAV